MRVELSVTPHAGEEKPGLMNELWTGCALVLLIEGCLHALFPECIKQAAARAGVALAWLLHR
jgi:uncharacterized protein YjeT (DUF2065 family)